MNNQNMQGFPDSSRSRAKPFHPRLPGAHEFRMAEGFGGSEADGEHGGCQDCTWISTAIFQIVTNEELIEQVFFRWWDVLLDMERNLWL